MIDFVALIGWGLYLLCLSFWVCVREKECEYHIIIVKFLGIVDFSSGIMKISRKCLVISFHLGFPTPVIQ